MSAVVSATANEQRGACALLSARRPFTSPLQRVLVVRVPLHFVGKVGDGRRCNIAPYAVLNAEDLAHILRRVGERLDVLVLETRPMLVHFRQSIVAAWSADEPIGRLEAKIALAAELLVPQFLERVEIILI